VDLPRTIQGLLELLYADDVLRSIRYRRAVESNTPYRPLGGR
jgi:hypothetical protein